MRVAELRVFQCSKYLDVDDDMYPMSSHYTDFSLERHEAFGAFKWSRVGVNPDKVVLT
jgi:hypothetical protein